MKVGLCVIGRFENIYAVEYVEWYKKLGFDKIFIYDNNRDGEEYFEDVLQSFIDDGFVEITDFRNKGICQLEAYTDCYNKHKNEYDWIAFFDFDEYLVLKKDNDIHSFLKGFEGFQCVKINWMVYTDNDLVFYDKRPLNERFTTPMDFDKCIQYSFPENNHVKSIVKCDIDNFNWYGNPHIPTCVENACNAEGEKSDITAFQPYNFDVAYLKHFITKTIEEWLCIKIRRGTPDINYAKFIEKNNDRFFKYNVKTKEKENYINSINLDIFIGTHKTFEPKVTNNIYKIIVGNHDIENHSNLKLINCKHDSPLDDRFFSEIYMLNYIVKNVTLKKYIGLCHYRKYFSFMDDIPNMDELFNEYDCIVGKPLQLNITTRKHYATFHNIEDLEIVENIIKEKYNDYYDSLESFLDNNLLIPYNMFIMKKEDFKEYCDFVIGVMNEYLNIVGTDIKGRIENNKEKYLKSFSPNDTVEYQYRIGGYIIERLTNVFMIKHFKKLKWYKVIVTEEKYNKRDS